MTREVTVCISFILFFSLLECAFAEPDHSSPPSILAFADWLVAEGEYVRAAGEYYRYLFYAPVTEKDSVLYKIGRCYFQAREYGKAVTVDERLLKEYPQSSRFEDAYYDAAYCLFKLGEYNQSSLKIEMYDTMDALSPPFLLLDGVNYLLGGDWSRAAAILQQYLVSPTALDKTKAQELLELTASINSLPSRSPVLAAVFSAFIPGTGKLYAGRTEDGIVSFILVGLCAGMAVYSFLSEGTQSVKAWLYTSVGGIFYLGDIWGSIVAAEQFNSGRREQIDRKVKERVGDLFP
jgi:TM2 domain-containing membrane protein YozV